jgi:cytochrome c biogenesis protein CcmG, thiol:disulfide interchange protein DsbE
MSRRTDGPAPPRRVAPFVAGAVAVVLGLFVVLLATRDDDLASASPLIGKVAPPIVGTGFRGEAFDIDRERGNWVLVNFFSTTCIPCRIEHPEIVEFVERRQAAGDLSVVSITFDDRGEAVQRFFETYGGDWPVLVENTGSIAISYGVAAVPESFLVAPSGVVARKIIGGVTADGLERLIAAMEAGP